MRVSTSWIKYNLGRTISDRKIIEALERAGIEVEQYSCSTSIDENIVVGMVQNVRQHPEADRLHIATVLIGSAEFEVVCGAPNVRAGILVPFAQIGSILPSGDVIEKAKLRGVISNGMLCSGRELGLSDDHEGLLELGAENKPGTTLSKIYPADSHLDLKTQANRFDLLSVLGLAREVAAQLDIPTPQYTQTELLYSSKNIFIASTEASVQRIQFAELTVDPSCETPDWMIQRLLSAGVRSISIIVDITNYVMLEYGQPLHAYDADDVSLPFSVRFAEKGEKLTTLDGNERKLTADDLVVADVKGILGLAGVMGGAKSEVSEKTKRIYLEAASFDGGLVRKMAKRHGLRSEASARFERGLPVQLQPVALAYAVELLEKHAGAKFVAAEDKLSIFPYEYRIGLRSSYASKMLGIELFKEEIVVILARLGIEAKPFDIMAEAKSHLDKPYKWGATFKQDRSDAFDCSYLTDYLYSLIRQEIGHTSLGQYEVGMPVDEAELLPGDILFYRGHDAGDKGDYGLDEIQSADSSQQPHSIKGHYYLKDSAADGFNKIEAKTEGLVGHNGLYIGDGKVIHAAKYEYVDGAWTELKEPRVMEVSVDAYTQNPTYLGARRFVENLDDWISVAKAPWWRTDLRSQEDLLEELARTIGYDKIPATIPAWHPKEVSFDRVRRPKQQLRDLLTGLGLYEVMTYSFVSAEQIAGIGDDATEYLKLKNPLSSEQAYLRRSLLPSHLRVLEQNRKDFSEVAFYELSGVFHPKDKGELPDEPLMLAITTSSSAEGYRYVKGIWDQIVAKYVLDYQFIIEDMKPYAAGRMARIMVRGKEIGRIGQILPSVLRAHKLEGEVGFLEVSWDLVLAAAQTVSYSAILKFPAANRDLTILVPLAAEWVKIGKALNIIAGVEARYGGDYYSDDLPAGYRSLTIHLELSASDHTLGDVEVLSMMVRVEQLLQNKFKAKAR